jgi:hypothetical protein
VNASKRIVLVASGSSPDRAIALERLLAAAAARSGWSERLEIRLGGVGAGAGRISDTGLAALQLHGVDGSGAVCPDLERRRALLEGASFVVCDRGDVADLLVDWDEAGEAAFVVVAELARPDADDEDGDDPPIAEDLRHYERVIEEVLRQIVAGTPAD